MRVLFWYENFFQKEYSFHSFFGILERELFWYENFSQKECSFHIPIYIVERVLFWSQKECGLSHGGVRTNNFFTFIFSCPNSSKSAEKNFFHMGGGYPLLTCRTWIIFMIVTKCKVFFNFFQIFFLFLQKKSVGST